jgi:uncharacterized protein YcgI (DUF1989 family)
MTDANDPDRLADAVHDEIVPARRPWARLIRRGELLRLVDLDTIYGCCSEANNFLRYGVRGTPSCYANFLEALRPFGLDRSAIVGNVNFFMQVPLEAGGTAAVAAEASLPGGFVELRAERDTLAVLSNCPQVHNPCNVYNPTSVRVIVRRTD